MPIVNYVREHMRFMDYATDERLSGSERLLWYALMHIFNQRAQGRVWPDEFIRIANDRLLLYFPMQFDALAQARNKLKQRGLIDYLPGDKNKVSPAYRIIYFYPTFVAPETDGYGEETAFYPAGYPEKPDKVPDNLPNNLPSNMPDKASNNSINNTVLQTSSSEEEDDEEEDEEEEETRARALETLVRSLWENRFAVPVTRVQVHYLAHLFRLRGFREDGVLREAFDLAAGRCNGAPYSYLHQLLNDWGDNGVRTVEDVHNYCMCRDALRGKCDWIDPIEASGMLAQMREKARAEA